MYDRKTSLFLSKILFSCLSLIFDCPVYELGRKSEK